MAAFARPLFLVPVIVFIILSFKLCGCFMKEPELFLFSSGICTLKEPFGVEALLDYSCLAARNYGTTKAESEDRLVEYAASPEALAPPLLIGGLPPVAFGFEVKRVGLLMDEVVELYALFVFVFGSVFLDTCCFIIKAELLLFTACFDCCWKLLVTCPYFLLSMFFLITVGDLWREATTGEPRVALAVLFVTGNISCWRPSYVADGDLSMRRYSVMAFVVAVAAVVQPPPSP